MAVQISILAANVAALLDVGYTRVEVWRSVDDGNSYDEVTASVAAAAILKSSPASTKFRMGGKLLKFKVNGGVERSVSFDPVLDYWTPTQVATRINEVINVATVLGQQMILTSTTTGRGSELEITYSDGPDLGFSAGQIALGRAARITLVGGTFAYLFSDVAGGLDDRYKWRFSANGVNPFSPYSVWVFGSTAPLAGTENLSVCSATFLDGEGRPSRTKVIYAVLDVPQSLLGFVVTGGPKVFESDDNGFIQLTFVRGAKVRLAIEGTTFVKDFTVPDATSFDLLAVMNAVPDNFSIQTVAPLLNRRSV